MPSDFSGLDNFTRSFPEQLKAFAQNIAERGEEYLKAHDNLSPESGNFDTGSLRASITGYEANSGNEFVHFNDGEWQTARREGNINGLRARQVKQGIRKAYHHNEPVNYEPAEPEPFYSDADAVAVVTAWVQYAFDDPIQSAIASAFMDTLNVMGEYILSPWAIGQFKFDQATNRYVFSKLNSPSNPNRG